MAARLLRNTQTGRYPNLSQSDQSVSLCFVELPLTRGDKRRMTGVDDKVEGIYGIVTGTFLFSIIKADHCI